MQRSQHKHWSPRVCMSNFTPLDLWSGISYMTSDILNFLFLFFKLIWFGDPINRTSNNWHFKTGSYLKLTPSLPDYIDNTAFLLIDYISILTDKEKLQTVFKLSYIYINADCIIKCLRQLKGVADSGLRVTL